MRCTGVAKSNPGFTLLELLVVLVILTILGSLTIPRFIDSVRREQLTASSRQAMNWLEDIRNQALKEMISCDISLTLDSTQQGVLAVKDTSPGCSQQEPLLIGSGGPKPTLITINSQEQGEIELLFSPRGTISSNHEIKLTMTGASISRCLRISSPLGLIRMGTHQSNQCDYSQAL